MMGMRPLDYLTKIESKKIILDRKNLMDFLFEYACQIAEEQKIIPYKAPKYLEALINEKLKEILILSEVVSVSAKNYSSFNLQKLDKSVIPKLVRQEFNVDGKGFIKLIYTGKR